jgi:hypothetical protein
MMEEKKIQMLQVHLTYEFDMLDASYEILSKQRLAEDATPVQIYGRNCAIEAFWLHTRNLLEFFEWESSDRKQASAVDFMNGDHAIYLNRKALRDLINDQVCHLHYNRYSSPVQEKLGPTNLHQAMETLQRGLADFQRRLDDEAKKYWTMRPRVPVVFPAFATEDDLLRSTTTSASTKAIGADELRELDNYREDE